MSSPYDSEGDQPQQGFSPSLPTIRREAPPSQRFQPVEDIPEDDDHDEGSGLWIDDDEPVGNAEAASIQGQGVSQGNLEDSWTADEELPDPDALFLQMQGAAPVEEDELPDPETLFLQMQGSGPIEEEELPDPETLFLQMQGAAPIEEEELPDPETLFLQMQGAAPVEEEELPDPEALFLQMQGAGPVDDEDLPDPQTLFLQMQGAGPVDEEELPDPEALFLQMQGLNLVEEEDLPDPDALFLQMQGPLSGFEDTSSQSLSLDSLQGPQVAEPSPEDDSWRFLLAQDDESSEQPEPEPLKLLIPDPLPPVAEPTIGLPDDDLPDPSALFLVMKAREVDEELFHLAPLSDREDESLDESSLFLQMQARSEPRPGVQAQGADSLFLQHQDYEPLQNTPFVEPTVDDLPDPEALFLAMQGIEKSSQPARRDSDLLENDTEWLPDLPEPESARLQRHAEEEPLEEKTGLFSRIKARFTRDKKLELDAPELFAGSVGVGASLPDPAELFRRMQGDDEVPDDRQDGLVPNELFRRRKGGEAEGLPALPDLDAFRAELEAEERANLDADLLGELSGPERLVDTVSDLMFNTGTFFQDSPKVSSFQKPAERRQDKFSPPPVPTPEEPLPAMLSKPVSVPKPQPPNPSRSEAVRPVYQPTAKPPQRKSTSTVIMAKDKAPEPAVPKPTLTQRFASYSQQRKRLTRATLSGFTRQMAAMLKAGIALHQSISFCAEADPEAAPLLQEVCGKIESGYSLSAALRDYPDSFDPVYVGLVHAGELSGRLNEMLAKLADILERELELRKRMISVITYPAMLMAVSILGTLGFIFFVLPQLTPLFLDLKVELPWPTKVLLSLRSILLPLTVSCTLVVVVLLAMKGRIAAYVEARPPLQRRLAYIPLSLPIVGKVYDKLVTARVLYSLATMLEVGVTMNQALARAEGTSGNAYVGYRLSRARMDLAEGASVTECFQANQVFPEMALQLIAAGEESARLVDMFTYVARHFDEEVEQAMTSAASMLEPLIMVGMGLIVGFITIAAALPTIKLLQGF